MTSLDVNEKDSVATIEASLEAGVNFFDTAYCYGADGESERLLGRVLSGRWDEVVLATKGGIHWEGKRQVQDGSAARLRRECDESLSRLGIDCVDLLYLHAPDPEVPLAESAGALLELMREGKTRSVGLSNASLAQLREFHAVCPLSAYQPPYNMLERGIEQEILPWCRQENVAVVVFWPLLKGLLAGKLARDHVFQPGDGRAKYAMFQGEEWQKNQHLVNRLKGIAAEVGVSVAQLVIRWTIEQPGITAALCGAKRASQAQENAMALDFRLSDNVCAAIDRALEERGPAVRQRAVG
jgi:aryl-alcohol dehydrogenase-like predicted oxidoreductase